jgi:hypothetical protein
MEKATLKHCYCLPNYKAWHARGRQCSHETHKTCFDAILASFCRLLWKCYSRIISIMMLSGQWAWSNVNSVKRSCVLVFQQLCSCDWPWRNARSDYTTVSLKRSCCSYCHHNKNCVDHFVTCNLYWSEQLVRLALKAVNGCKWFSQAMTDSDKCRFATNSRLDVNGSWKYAVFNHTHTWHQYKQGTAHLEYLTLSGTMAQPGHLRPVMCVHNIWSRTRQNAVHHHFRSAIILLVRHSPMTFNS